MFSQSLKTLGETENKKGKKTSSGMIACQDKWHPSALAQVHIHLPLAASRAYREVGGGGLQRSMVAFQQSM